MRIGIVGAGNIARMLTAAGHQVTVSFSRDSARLQRLADQLGVHAGSPRQAVGDADVVVLSVRWGVIDEALAAAGGPAALAGRTVVDTTNQSSRTNGAWQVVDRSELSAAAYNARKGRGRPW